MGTIKRRAGDRGLGRGRSGTACQLREVASICIGVDQRERQPSYLAEVVGMLNHCPAIIGDADQLQLLASVDTADSGTARLRTAIDRDCFESSTRLWVVAVQSPSREPADPASGE